MFTLTVFLLGLYFSVLLFIVTYCMLQFVHLYDYNKYHASDAYKKLAAVTMPDDKLPFVTIQLPLFNELYVTERLLDNIVLLDYPKDKYEIQVLDDSTDESLEISRKKVAELKAKGFNIELIRRPNRKGFKAGALKYGMETAKGEFLAIFDADFLPRPNFLKATVPHFYTDDKIGVVQTRWEHLNRDYSLITRLQAMQLNVHFTIEQTGRCAGNHFLQFNGTAGVWRKKTIDDAGGWEADTLTEDLDLSYRAQLKGWRIHYLEYIGSPAELPVEMPGFKGQQFRWMKGGAENARKILPTVWRSNLSLREKMYSTMHLFSSSVFVMILVAGLISVPLQFLVQTLAFDTKLFSISLLGLLSVVFIYYAANIKAELGEGQRENVWKFMFQFPLFLSLSMGMSLHNALAVIEGWVGKQSDFIRTPKFGSMGNKIVGKKYFAKKIPTSTIVELLLAVYFLVAVIANFRISDHSFITFHTMLCIGFGSIAGYSIKHVLES